MADRTAGEEESTEAEALREALMAAFWVDLSPEEVPEGVAFGELFERIREKAGPSLRPACLTSVAFYRLRPELARLAGCGRRSIHPDTPLSTLFPSWRRRRAQWSGLDAATRLRLPGLVPPDGSGKATAACAFLMAGAAGSALFVPVFALGMFLAALTIGWLSRGIPGRLVTVGDLARSAAGLNHGKLSREAGGTTLKQMWRAFQEAAGEAEGVDPLLIEQ